MKRSTKKVSYQLRPILSCALMLAASFAIGAPQHLQGPTLVWSIGPLVKTEPVMGFAFGTGGATFSGPTVNSQTRSIFAATRSMVFAGDRIVIAAQVGTRRVVGGQAPENVYKVLSLDLRTGKIKNAREVLAFGSMSLFAAQDGNVIVCAHNIIRVTPDLKTLGSFDYAKTGHKFGNAENASPDGATLAITTNPGFALLNTENLQAAELTPSPAYATSVSSHGLVTDNLHWIRDYPKDSSFVTYTDAAGDRLLYHGQCGYRPQFLTDDLILVPGCRSPLIINTRGDLVRTLPLTGAFSFAGVAKNGKRLALQLTTSSDADAVKSEHFGIYSVETGELLADVKPEEVAEGQSWTAFSPDGSLFVVGSPLKLTLYHLPAN